MMVGLITLGEYVGYYQPAIAAVLWIQTEKPPDPELRMVVGLSFGEWKAIMEERPKPGRAGLAFNQAYK